MKLIERIKISWQGSEETASIAALISIPFIIGIVGVMFTLYFKWYEENSLNIIKSILIGIILIVISYIIFKIIHVIVNSFYHSINQDYFHNKLNEESDRKFSLLIYAIPLSLMALFELGRLFAFISEKASANPFKSGIIYFGLAFIAIIIYFLRKTIKNFLTNLHNNINGFLFSNDELKSIPILLTIITVFIFGFLIVLSAKKHSLDNGIGEDITPLSIGMVFVPLIVFLTSGTMIYKIHNKHQDNTAFNILLKVCTIISRIVLLSIFTFIIVMICIVDFRLSPDHLVLFMLYLGFLSFQIKRLKEDFAYLSLFRK